MKAGDLVRHRHGDIGVVSCVNNGTLTEEELQEKYGLHNVGSVGSVRVHFGDPAMGTSWYFPDWLEVISESR